MMLLKLSNGWFIFSEKEYTRDHEGFSLSPKHTLAIQPVDRGDGNVSLSLTPMDKDPMKPTKVFVHKHAVLFEQDVTDETTLTQFRAALSGIELAKDLPKNIRAFK